MGLPRINVGAINGLAFAQQVTDTQGEATEPVKRLSMARLHRAESGIDRSSCNWARIRCPDRGSGIGQQACPLPQAEPILCVASPVDFDGGVR
jgi:hypothetical protein